MSLSALTSSSSTGGTAEEGNGPDREQRKAGQGLAGSKDKEDSVGAAVAVQASPFDRLPDELVSAILDSVAQDLRFRLDTVCINKRFTRLARPLYVDTLKPSDEGCQSDLLQRLGRQSHLHPFVRRFEGFVSADYVVAGYDSTLLQFFINLTSLTLTVSLDHEAQHPLLLPTPFTDTLTNLRNLRHLSLEFDDPVSLEDPSFSIGQSLPRLERLELRFDHNEPDLLAKLPQNPSPNLRHLYLRVIGLDADACKLIPWSTLRIFGLEMKDDQEDEQSMQLLLASVKSAFKYSQDHLSFAFDNDICVENARFGKLDFGNPQLPSLFEAIKLLRVPRVHLCIRSKFIVPDDLVLLPTVHELHLGAYEFDGCAPDSTRDLSDLLQLFPSLHVLVLEGATYGSDPHVFGPSTEFPVFFFDRPNLLDLIHFLRSTSVLQFRWSPPDSGGEYRWWKTTAEEEFKAEHFEV